jgi:hypothetical protein
MIQDNKDAWKQLKLYARSFLQYGVKTKERPFKFFRKQSQHLITLNYCECI